MTRKTLLAAAFAAASVFSSSAALAGGEFDSLRDYQLPATTSTLSRAEVKAETRAALERGEVHQDNNLYGYAQPVKSTSDVTRAEVKAEAVAALKSPRSRYGFDGS